MAKDKTTKVEITKEQEAIKNLINSLNKKYGQNAVMLLGESNHMDIESISTGSLRIDKASGIGGFPMGRLVEVIGMESSGKTTLCLQTIAEAQKNGKVCAFIDVEQALNLEYAKSLGVDVDKLIFNQPDYGEQALTLVEDLAASGLINLIVLDSIAALAPKAEIDGELEDTDKVGATGKMMSKFCRTVTPTLSKNKCLLLMINQWRDNIGVMGYGDKKITPGGKAVKFYASQRVEVTKIGKIKKGEEVIGDETKVTFIKNKVAVPHKVAKTTMMYGYGFSQVYEVIDMAVENDIIGKAGSWFSYNDQKIGQGKEKVVETLANNKELFEEIKSKVVDLIKLDTMSKKDIDIVEKENETLDEEY